MHRRYKNSMMENETRRNKKTDNNEQAANKKLKNECEDKK
jgi:hypothetical protein